MMTKIKAYVNGMREFRLDSTTHYDHPLIETYDAGRDRAHALTFRFFDPCYSFGKRDSGELYG